jgi:hypothetical protein
MNIRNAEPLFDDWELLMSQVDMEFYIEEMSLFNS